MRNIILFIFFMCSSIVVSAQNSLDFSRVKLINSLDTVPSGKVWKIEGFVYTQPITLTNPSSGQTLPDASISINGISVAVRSSRITTGGTSPDFETWEQKTPIWLPSNSILNIGPGVTYISILEFSF